jgi:hypothetical protein
VIHINTFSIIHAYHLALLDFLKTAHLFVNSAAHNANNVKDQQIFVHNVQIKIKNYLFQQELAQIAVQRDNTLIKEQEAAPIVIQHAKFVKVSINVHHVRLIFCFIMGLVEQIVHPI